MDDKATSFKLYKKMISPKNFLSLAATDGVNFQFSESGEDIVLQKLFKNKVEGFYVDIGAFRPRKFSNTFLLHSFYGWKGMNVDASSDAIELFNKERPNDINLNIAVGNESGELDYWIFNEPATNTLSGENKERQLKKGKSLKSHRKVGVKKLVEILDDFLPVNQEIDVLNVDVEGLDLEVLKSNDWRKYRPKVVLVEDYQVRHDGLEKSEIYGFLLDNDYRFFSHTFDTTIYIENNFSENWMKDNDIDIWSDKYLETSLSNVPNLYQRSLALIKSHPAWSQLNEQLKENKKSTELKEWVENELNEIKGLQIEFLDNQQAIKELAEKYEKEREEKKKIIDKYERELEKKQVLVEKVVQLETTIYEKEQLLNNLLKELRDKKLIEMKFINKEINDTKNKFNEIKKTNIKLENKIIEKEADLVQLKSKIKQTKDKQNELKDKINLIESSRSWRYLNFARNIGAFIKGQNKNTVNSGTSNKDRKTTKKLNSVKDGITIYKASSLENKLWGGFSRYAVIDLENLKNADHISKNERAKAAWSLMRWYYVNEDYNEALKNLDFMNKVQPQFSIRRIVSQVNILVKLGEKSQARNLLEKAIEKTGYDPDLCLAMVNVEDDEKAKINWYNKIFLKNNFATIEKRDKSNPFQLNNIVAKPIMRKEKEHPKVSVIIPAYNAESVIHIAIESLIQQTWSNLEIIVIDDCSTDRTAEIVSTYANVDHRIKLISKERNEGAYAARNTALKYVSGEYITIHDSDDWSHPQKIESQMVALLSSDCVGVLSYWVRVLEDMTVNGPWFPKGTYFEENLSSLIFRKEVFDKVGIWDNVRVAGDTEFFWRVAKVYGVESILKHKPKVPLSFSLRSDTSLTRTKVTHARTVKFGLRRIYRESAKWWHENSEKLHLPLTSTERKFFAPKLNYPTSYESQSFDLVVVSDFNMQGGAFVSTYNYILAALKLNMKVGVFHWRRYDTDLGKPLNPMIYELASTHGVEILIPGDTVNANLVLVGYPVILRHKIDDFPKISCNSLVIVVNQMASRLLNGEDVQYDPLTIRKHAKEVFGHEGIYIPISPLVKRLMDLDGRYLPDPNNIWRPMIDTKVWCDVPLRWNGNNRERPIVGRHGRDHYTKWPADPIKIKQAYGVNQNWEVRFLGGAKTAINLLGKKPSNWNVLEFDSVNAKRFLEELDFFVHYTHDEYIEEFGRAVMEAMAVGVPVILPPKFEETFGSAALYAEPKDVADTINNLWRNRSEYLKRAEIGRKFVYDLCSIDSFKERIHKLNLK